MRMFFFCVYLCSMFTLSLAVLQAETMRCEVLAELERSKRGFTQGLFIDGGKLYESTGGYGSSLIRRFDLQSQELELSKALPADIFGEGITPFRDDLLLQLTWRKGLGIVYEKESLDIKKVFRYPTEGWGITAKGEEVVMSDGSAQLFFLHPDTFQVIRELTVTRGGKALERINEMEWVEDVIYANIWMTDEIVKINPETGEVLATIDCSGLLKKRPTAPDAVLNGIAYDPVSECFYITGKKWPTLYKVKFVKVED